MKKITVKKKSSMRIRQKCYKSFDNIILMLFFIFSLCIISTKKSQFFRHYNRGQHFVQKSGEKLDSFSYFCVLRLFFQFFGGDFGPFGGRGGRVFCTIVLIFITSKIDHLQMSFLSLLSICQTKFTLSAQNQLKPWKTGKFVDKTQ